MYMNALVKVKFDLLDLFSILIQHLSPPCSMRVKTTEMLPFFFR